MKSNWTGEIQELAASYVARGVDERTAAQVATQLMAHDALAAHAKEELGISEMTLANPFQAALASALAFSAGALVPIAAAAAVSPQIGLYMLPVVSVVTLAALGAVSAWMGKASIWRGTLRVTAWGIFAMVATSLIGTSL